MKQLLIVWKIGRAVLEECIRLGINPKSLPIDALIRVIKEALRTNQTVKDVAHAAILRGDGTSV